MISNPFKKELESIVEDSSRVLNIFTQTVNELATINSRIDDEAARKIEERDKLNHEIGTLGATKEKNAKIIGKIENLLN